MFGYLTAAVHDCECCQTCMYRAQLGPVQFMNMEAPGQVNKQGQLPAGGRRRRGEGGGGGGGGRVRVCCGRIGGRGRAAGRHHAVLDEIRATLIEPSPHNGGGRWPSAA